MGQLLRHGERWLRPRMCFRRVVRDIPITLTIPSIRITDSGGVEDCGGADFIRAIRSGAVMATVTVTVGGMVTTAEVSAAITART